MYFNQYSDNSCKEYKMLSAKSVTPFKFLGHFSYNFFHIFLAWEKLYKQGLHSVTRLHLRLRLGEK